MSNEDILAKLQSRYKSKNAKPDALGRKPANLSDIRHALEGGVESADGEFLVIDGIEPLTNTQIFAMKSQLPLEVDLGPPLTVNKKGKHGGKVILHL